MCVCVCVHPALRLKDRKASISPLFSSSLFLVFSRSYLAILMIYQESYSRNVNTTTREIKYIYKKGKKSNREPCCNKSSLKNLESPPPPLPPFAFEDTLRFVVVIHF